MNPNSPENPGTPEDQPIDTSQGVTVPGVSSPLPQPTPPVKAVVWYQKPFAWILVAFLLAVLGVGIYLVMKESNKNNDNSTVGEISAETNISAIDDTGEATPSESMLATDAYKGWNIFTSRIEGVGFKYPATMNVEEVLPTDKNAQGSDTGFTTITLLDNSQSEDSRYVFRISDSPWGCVGPDTWSLTYDVSIGEQTTTLKESCSGLVANVMFDGASEGASLVADIQYLLEDDGDFDRILASMTGITVR